jgi:hypothetical protein
MVLEESWSFDDVVRPVSKELKGAKLGDEGVHEVNSSRLRLIQGFFFGLTPRFTRPHFPQDFFSPRVRC